MFDYNFSELANAIIRQAAHDYLHPRDLEELKEVEAFFNSKWFATLTTIDSDEFFEKLKHLKLNKTFCKEDFDSIVDFVA